MSFAGFPPGKQNLVPIPGQFFAELLPQIDSLAELRVALYFFWALDRQEREPRWLALQDMLEDSLFMKSMTPGQVEEGLARATARGILLRAGEAGADAIYFLNTARGRQALQNLRQGKWRPAGRPLPPSALQTEPASIFRLYEQNIGPLTPMLADRLRDAENEYPAEWIPEALRLAVERNVRNWRYIEGILKRWKEEGRDPIDGGDAAQTRRKYIQGKYSDFVEH